MEKRNSKYQINDIIEYNIGPGGIYGTIVSDEKDDCYIVHWCDDDVRQPWHKNNLKFYRRPNYKVPEYLKNE